MSQKEVKTSTRRNRKLLDSTSTSAIRTLASGLMHGTTNPARRWFRLRISGFDPETMSHPAKSYLSEVQRRMMLVMAESNFYNAMAELYLDWCTFGTAAMLIYEDFDDVIRCRNLALGEFFLGQDDKRRVNRIPRRFTMEVDQIVRQFGIDNVSLNVKNLHKEQGGGLFSQIDIHYMLEPNQDDGLLKTGAAWREAYWEATATNGNYLSVSGFNEWPGVAARWNVQGNDTYGSSPAMDALADVQELQNVLVKKGQGLAKQLSPPLIVDQQLKSRPKALGANGITYAPTATGNFGAKPVYQVTTPLQELQETIIDLRSRIRETCFNDLFTKVSNLETVRSATEINAIEREKLVMLGPVLERFQREVLSNALTRIFGIMGRKDLLPESPPELGGQELEVEYVSILSDAQQAGQTATVERFFAFTGQVAGVYPEVLDVVKPSELVRQYAEGLSIDPKGLNSHAESQAIRASREEAQALQQAAALGETISKGAKNLSDTDVGAGQNALQLLTG